MAIIKWSDEYSLGLKVIDKQHQLLVNMINRMHEVVTLSDGTEMSQIRRIFVELSDYMDNHFKTEEELLKIYHFPEIQSHRQQHNKLAMQLLELQLSFSKGHRKISLELLEFLNNWFINHIMVSDQKYASFILAKKTPES